MKSSVPPAPPTSPLVIRVTIARRNPPAGTASAEQNRAHPFESWFELLDALSRIICLDDGPAGKGSVDPSAPDVEAPASDPRG